MIARRRLGALAVCLALVAPTLLPPASAGTLTTFDTGPSVVLGPGGSSAVTAFPNPARAMSASVDVSPVISVEAVSASPPAAWRFTFDSCATVSLDAVYYRQLVLDASNLSLIAAQDGASANLSVPSQRPGLLFEVPVPANFLNARPWNATFRVVAVTDGAQPPDGSTFTLALFAPPGLRPWRVIPLTYDPTNSSVLEATVAHPAPQIGGGGQSLVGLLVPNNGSAMTLLVDSLEVTMRRFVLPASPELEFAGGLGPFWQFQFPGAGATPILGRTVGFMGGAPEFYFGSNGTAAGGATPPFHLPEGSLVSGAFVELSPESAGGVASSTGGPATAPAGGASAPGTVALGPLPLTARPTVANVVLTDLVLEGTLDATQPADLTPQFIGNQSLNERAAAQTLTIESDGTLSAIAILLRNGTARPVGPLQLEVRNVTLAGEPGSAVLSATSFNASEAVLGGWATFALDSPIPVVAGQSLAIVVTATGAVSGEYWEWGRHDGLPSDPYVNGSNFIALNASAVGSWIANDTRDFAFRALVDRPVDQQLAMQVSVAGSLGPGIPSPLPNNRTEYLFTVPGFAVTIDPAGATGRWNISVVNGLGDSVRFNWSAFLDYSLYPRNVEVRVADEAPAITIPELDETRVIDFTDALAAALASGNLTVTPAPWGGIFEVPLNVRSEGPASIYIRDATVAYNVTLHIAGFTAALNQVLSAIAPSEPVSEALIQLSANEGEVVLSNLSIEYSEAPRSFPPAQAAIPEGAVNATVADLLQLFTDDYDTFNLTYAVVSLFPDQPAVATAQIHRTALDANLTVTMTDTEFAGALLIAVLATDTTGLAAVAAGIPVEVTPVADPPVLPAVLPELALTGTVGSFDLAPHILDNDTGVASLTVTVSSPFATLNGFVISFDYRQAPPTLLQENVTITVSDGTTTVTALLSVLIENAGRPTIIFPAPGTLVVTAGRNLSIDLRTYAADNRPVAELQWELLLAAGDGAAQLISPSTLVVTGHRAGNVSITVAARDRELNPVNGTLVVSVRANAAPQFTALHGSAVTVTTAPLTIDLREFLTDADDPFSNLTFVLAWDNGSFVQANVSNGIVTVTRTGEAGGHARLTVTASDPSGATAAASIEVDVEGPPPGGSSFLLLLGALIAAGLLGALLYRSYRHGKADRRSYTGLARQEGRVELDEDEKLLESPEGIEPTEEERMLHQIDEMSREAGAARLELPPVTIVSPGGALATSSVLLLYRDGRPIAWVAAARPSDPESELEQEVAAAAGERLKKSASGARIEGESIEMGGRTFAVEARAQLVLVARVEGGPKNQTLRQAMRIALEDVFDRNTGALKRWDGSAHGLKGLDDALESVMQVAPVPGGDPAPKANDAGEE